MRQGIQHITNYRASQQPPPDSNALLAEELNHFFACFATAESDNGATPPLDAANPRLTRQTHEMRRIFSAMNVKKAGGLKGSLEFQGE